MRKICINGCNIMKNKLILVAGHSAAGKSTFAFNLSHRLKIPCFSKDTIKESMADGFGSDNEFLQKRGTEATISMMLHIAECFLRIGKVCILEANFRPPQDKQIEELLKKYDVDCLTFLFGGNLEVLWDRYLQRESERHWTHKFIGQSKDRFINGGIKAGFGDFAIGQTIRIDATDFSKIDYDELFSVANQFVTSCSK